VTADLVAQLESPLPASLPVGAATAVFCYGTCLHRRERIARLEIVVDGRRHRPAAAGMPRRSAFWGTVPVPARAAPGAVEVGVVARLASGAEVGTPLGRIDVVAEEPAGGAAAPGQIAVCMATYEPDIALFRTQVESLRAQTDANWICVISDDGSSPEHLDAIRTVLGDDERFRLSPSPERLGFYRNFERSLRLAPAGAELVALCDQDDRWHPDKLAVLRAALGSAQLVYSDQRLVDAEGRLLRDTMWHRRRNNHTSLASMLVANSITGAAALFRREVVDLALPFPETPGLQFHDHWLALVALATGTVAYVDRPLYDYVQHRGAFFGEVTHGGEPVRRRLAGVLRGGRAAYFRGYMPRAVQAEVLLVRCGPRLSSRKRRALRRFVAADRSTAALAWLAVRPLRVLAGRTETLGSESELVRGLLWRRVVRLVGLDTALPGLLSFQQRRLRRWRARV
jgi:glycosyltransferase involved in cell wall biosynthesis